MSRAGLLLSAYVALCLAATLIVGDGCTPAEMQTVAADLPGAEQVTTAACAIAEGSTMSTAAGPVVNLICTGVQGAAQLAGAILKAAPSATVTTMTPDAGMAAPAVVSCHAVPLRVAQSVVVLFPQHADAG